MQTPAPPNSPDVLLPLRGTTETLHSIAVTARTLALAATMDKLSEALATHLAGLVPFAELICDLTTFDLNRPALIRLGTDDAWTKRYNTEFFHINPATTRLRHLVTLGGLVAQRFEDLCRGPLAQTPFYQQYMRPQGHSHSLIGAMPLSGIAAANVAPALLLLLVRYDGAPPFSTEELDAITMILPALALALGRVVRSSDEWAGAVVKHAFALPPKLAEVALLIAQGLPNRIIADRLGITLGTTKHYVHKLLEATGTSSRADLCRLLLS